MKFFLPLLLIFGLYQSAHAKIGDCPVIQENGIIYKSHGNYVEAFTGVTETDESKLDIKNIDSYIKEMQNRNILWHTQLLTNDKVENPFLESDVQANITCVERLDGDELLVSDRRGRRFMLDKHTGKLLESSQSEDYRLIVNTNIADDHDGFVAQDTRDIASHINKFQWTGDYALIIKRINYIKDSMMIVYANKTTQKHRYDISLSLPNGNTYILTNVPNQQTLALVKEFADNKSIDITRNWQNIDSLVKEDNHNSKLEAWYDQNYRAARMQQYEADKAKPH